MILYNNKIKQALKKPLPGSKSHKKMLPPGRVLKALPKDKGNIKLSSVLLLLFPDGNDLKICLIKRPAHMKHHAGQIALPGGRIEANETATETALRETSEEIGVVPNSIQILGFLSDFYIEVSRFQITPIIGWLNEKPAFKLNPDEVEKTILFPVEKFKPPYKKTELETLTGKLNVPCIKFEDETIWGATAMILAEFYDVLQQNNLIVESP